MGRRPLSMELRSYYQHYCHWSTFDRGFLFVGGVRSSQGTTAAVVPLSESRLERQRSPLVDWYNRSPLKRLSALLRRTRTRHTDILL